MKGIVHMPVLSGKEIRLLIEGDPPLVEGWLDLAAQVQPNGFDLTLRDIARVASAGSVTVDNGLRRVADLEPLVFDDRGGIDLPSGVYMITYNEIVRLPKTIMALGRPRSSLLRCGVSVGTAVWDAGYHGRSQSLLVVHNPAGFRVESNARLTQLVFFKLSGEAEGYSGKYQGENIG